MIRQPPRSTLFPTRRSSDLVQIGDQGRHALRELCLIGLHGVGVVDDQNHVHRVVRGRSEEHTSELQSQSNLVCRLLLEKKNKSIILNKMINVRHLAYIATT